MSTTLTPAATMIKRPKTLLEPAQVDMRRVAAVILGGGQGTRLYPLTHSLCKPAICFAGEYCLIDVAISNAINAGCDKIYVITQFLSNPLHKHICSTYQGSNIFSNGFVDILSAEQRPTAHNWYQGTADAVRQNLYYLKDTPADYFLILSGDQLYNMDFRNMFAFALGTDADLVLATLPVQEEEAKRMGLMKIDAKGEVKSFAEKPQHKEVLDSFEVNASTRKRLGLPEGNPLYLGSMGIYLFKRQALIDLLEQDPREDFGKHLIPTKMEMGNTFAYLHGGYWEDIGTIRSFYDANIGLTYPNPHFEYYSDRFLLKKPSHLPGTKIFNAMVNNSIICQGCVIEADEITHSIVGPRSIIKKGCVIRHSYLMGNDFYEPPSKQGRYPQNLQISEDCYIQNAIIDKNVFIGKGVRLLNKNNVHHYDSEYACIRDGIIVVPRGACLPDGFTL